MSRPENCPLSMSGGEFSLKEKYWDREGRTKKGLELRRRWGERVNMIEVEREDGDGRIELVDRSGEDGRMRRRLVVKDESAR